MQMQIHMHVISYSLKQTVLKVEMGRTRIWIRCDLQIAAPISFNYGGKLLKIKLIDLFFRQDYLNNLAIRRFFVFFAILGFYRNALSFDKIL
jgi:hypothetical protein